MSSLRTGQSQNRKTQVAWGHGRLAEQVCGVTKRQGQRAEQLVSQVAFNSWPQKRSPRNSDIRTDWMSAGQHSLKLCVREPCFRVGDLLNASPIPRNVTSGIQGMQDLVGSGLVSSGQEGWRPNLINRSAG